MCSVHKYSLIPCVAQILTKDSVTVKVDAVLYFRVFDPILSVTNVANASHSTWLLAQTTLRNVLGTKSLQELLSHREGISHEMQVSFVVSKLFLSQILPLFSLFSFCRATEGFLFYGVFF